MLTIDDQVERFLLLDVYHSAREWLDDGLSTKEQVAALCRLRVDVAAINEWRSDRPLYIDAVSTLRAWLESPAHEISSDELRALQVLFGGSKGAPC